MSKNLKPIGNFVYLWHTRHDYTSLLHKSQYLFLVFMTKNLFISLKKAKTTKKVACRNANFSQNFAFRQN